MVFVTVKENFNTQTEVSMKEIGIKVQWMVWVTCTIQMESLLMRESGKIMPSLVKVVFIMKIQFHLIIALTSPILIIFQNIGRSTKESSKTISKKDSAHFIS